MPGLPPSVWCFLFVMRRYWDWWKRWDELIGLGERLMYLLMKQPASLELWLGWKVFWGGQQYMDLQLSWWSWTLLEGESNLCDEELLRLRKKWLADQVFQRISAVRWVQWDLIKVSFFWIPVIAVYSYVLMNSLNNYLRMAKIFSLSSDGRWFISGDGGQQLLYQGAA